MKNLTKQLLYKGDNVARANVVWNIAGSFVYAFASMVLSFLVIRMAGEEKGGIFSFGYSTLGQQLFLVAYFGIRPFQITDGKGEYSFKEYREHRNITCMFALVAGALFLTACSHNSSLPPFTASGFAEDQGAVRIWRKDSGDNVHLLAVFSPWRSGDTTTREYRWQGDNLTLININVYSKPPVNIRARFDDRGDLSFMQRESDGEKQQLSNDQIDLYRYRADQIRQISDALRQGRVVLRQGRWHAMEQTVTTCEGQTIKPDLDSQAIAHIERRQSRSSVDVSVAWLEAPEGSQLLLVANSDFCRWQPNEKTF